MFETVIVANRGEIAVRIIRTLRALGIRAVAVYSDADAQARHVRDADAAFRLGPAPALESYLSIERVVQAAIASGAQALHPGYGFLSENTALAAACAEAGIVFVGPPASAIEAMGDKIRAKATVEANGVSVVPGISGVGLTDDELVAKALTVGFPMLLKPSAGGGGKGMRLVTEEAGLADAIAGAKREARNAFGDDTLLVERFIQNPRHIEVQVLADAHGNVVHLGERECSLQRRHQKVIEEAPSPLLTAAARDKIGAQAVAAAEACGYVNAGTVEFIVSGDQPDEPFFMEMNTRLQVEHPVTELVWGVDLVELQLRIAAGERLPFTQADLAPNGWAMEARVYAEDPSRNFLPTGGRVLRLSEPDEVGIRIDSSLVEHAEIGSTYDPMLSKVIVWGEDRDTTRRRLSRALAATTVLGVTNNIGFLRNLLAHPDVVAGTLDTSLIERVTDSLTEHTTGTSVLLAGALIARQLAIRSVGSDHTDAWDDLNGWRVGGVAWSVWTATYGTETVSIRHRAVGDGFELAIGTGDDADVRTVAFWIEGNDATIELDGVATRYEFVKDGRVLWLAHDGETWNFTEPDPHARADAAAATSGGSITSPMPGTVVAVSVAVGDAVTAGQTVVVVEAMKMEHALTAPGDGVVAELPVAVGDRVALNQQLAMIDLAETAAPAEATA